MTGHEGCDRKVRVVEGCEKGRSRLIEQCQCAGDGWSSEP